MTFPAVAAEQLCIKRKPDNFEPKSRNLMEMSCDQFRLYLLTKMHETLLVKLHELPGLLC
jgi:hypothetical protein